jgi:chromosome segregation ATPase
MNKKRSSSRVQTERSQHMIEIAAAEKKVDAAKKIVTAAKAVFRQANEAFKEARLEVRNAKKRVKELKARAAAVSDSPRPRRKSGGRGRVTKNAAALPPIYPLILPVNSRSESSVT